MMALMPLNCENAINNTAITSTLRKRALGQKFKKSGFALLSKPLWSQQFPPPLPADHGFFPAYPCASPSRPTCTNQRGLSFTKKSRTSNNTAGNTSAPSIHRQPVGDIPIRVSESLNFGIDEQASEKSRSQSRIETAIRTAHATPPAPIPPHTRDKSWTTLQFPTR